MMTLNSPQELTQLPLDDEIVTLVRNEIIEPFGSITDAAVFWRDVGTNLLFLESTDDLDALAKSDSGLAFAMEYPEWSLDLPQGYQLSLSIYNDEGSGCYLLCPSHLINKDN